MCIPLWQLTRTAVKGDRQASEERVRELGEPVRSRLHHHRMVRSHSRYSAVLGHFNHPDDRPWMHLAGGAAPKLAQVLGMFSL